MGRGRHAVLLGEEQRCAGTGRHGGAGQSIGVVRPGGEVRSGGTLRVGVERDRRGCRIAVGASPALNCGTGDEVMDLYEDRGVNGGVTTQDDYLRRMPGLQC